MSLFRGLRATRLRRTRWHSIASRLVVATLFVIIPLGAGSFGQSGKDNKVERRTDFERRQETRYLVETIDSAMAGAQVPSGIPMTWQPHFLKGRQRATTYVPFTLVIEPSMLMSPSVALCVRVVQRSATTQLSELMNGAGRAGAGHLGDSQTGYTFQEVYFLDLKASYGSAVLLPSATTSAAGGGTRSSGQRTAGRAVYRISRAFAAPAGDYDVYFAIRERAAGLAAAGGQTPGAAKTGVAKESVTVPNYWNDELAASSIILIDRVDSLGAPVPPEQQTERPYALGNTEILPLLEAKLWKTQELAAVFFVYNPTVDASGKPNVTVDYGFQNTDKTGPLRKTPPLTFDARTLPSQFDSTAGYQISAGQSVPLSSFSEGEYRLGVTVIDNNSGKSVTQDVVFSVVPSLGS